MKTGMKLAGLAVAGAALLSMGAPASAATIQCPPPAGRPADYNYTEVTGVDACLASGMGNIGQGGGNDVFLPLGAGSGYTLVGQSFGSSANGLGYGSSTWRLAPTF